MGGDAGFVVGSRCLRDQIFCGRTRDRPFCAIHSAVASAHRRRHGSTGCGPVAILPALANPRAECPSLAMAMVSLEGLATHLGFGILAWLWFMTALQAYRAIGRGEIEAHQRWMMRNFALSLAAVTLRNELPLMLFALHCSFHASYITLSWLCWVPNLIVAEWMVRRRRKIITSLAYAKAERSL